MGAQVHRYTSTSPPPCEPRPGMVGDTATSGGSCLTLYRRRIRKDVP